MATEKFTQDSAAGLRRIASILLLGDPVFASNLLGHFEGRPFSGDGCRAAADYWRIFAVLGVQRVRVETGAESRSSSALKMPLELQ